MSTRIHQDNVHKKSPQKRNSSGQKCPQEFMKSVQKNLPILSTRIRLLYPLEFFHPKKSAHFLQYCNVGCIILRPKIEVLYTDFVLILSLNLFSISRHLWMPPPQTTTIPVFSFCTQHLRHFSLLKANVFQEKRGSPRYLVLDIQKQF